MWKIQDHIVRRSSFTDQRSWPENRKVILKSLSKTTIPKTWYFNHSLPITAIHKQDLLITLHYVLMSLKIRESKTRYLYQSIYFMLIYTYTKFHSFSLNYLAFRERGRGGWCEICPSILELPSSNRVNFVAATKLFNK